MRIALVSPYSWTYPGGVTRHIQALAESFLATGHHVRVLAPVDPPGPVSAALHRGAHPQRLDVPDYVVALGRTVGLKANGAVSNLSFTPFGVATMHRELRAGRFDVVHVHEPIAPVLSWVAADATRLPLVGTFHTYNENKLSNGLANLVGARRVFNHLHVRIAVSEAAAWTARRFFGGHYRVIPNGVHVDPDRARRGAAIPTGESLRIVFVGQAVERKGLPLLLRAFEALHDHIPAELTIIGPTEQEFAPLLLETAGVRGLGKVGDERKRTELERAHVLVAPSLGGESFGMVLTEAFAAGTPVVASDIAGYRDVVRDGVDGVLVPPGDPTRLAEALRDVWEQPERRRRMAEAAAREVERFAWARVSREVLSAYEDALQVPEPAALTHRVAVRVGGCPADLKPRAPAQRLPSLQPRLQSGGSRVLALARRSALAVASLGGIALAVLALQKIGVASIGQALITSSPAFVLIGLGIMCSSMFLRALSWWAILRAALPRARIRMADSMQGQFIGVLMSSTLPARLGEPSRALVVARRTGRPRENLPIVLGTLVSQTLLNIVALIALGAVMFSSVDIFSGHQNALLVAAVAPLALLVVVLLAPLLLRRGTGRPAGRAHQLLGQARRALTQVRSGLVVFRHPREGLIAAAGQLGAWALQWLSCYMLVLALGLGRQAGVGAAAAVLFAVNVTAVLPATPANVGVFQAAAAAVLHAGWHVSYGTGIAYGVILQAVEVSTAIIMGMPALLKEGMSWREVRLRALHATPVKLPPRPGARRGARSPGTAESG